MVPVHDRRVIWFKYFIMSQLRGPGSRLYQAYREYIQFLSELRISQPFSSILLAMSSVVLLADLLFDLASDDAFSRQLTYIGLATAIKEVITSSPALLWTVGGVMVGTLLSPGVAAGCIGLATWTGKDEERGFKQQYEDSFLNVTLRYFLSTLVLIFMPLFTSIAVAFLQGGGGEAALGVIVLVLCLLDCLLVEYHTFDFGGSSLKDLVVTNYPYRIVDDLLIMVALVVANASSGTIGSVLGVLFIGLRLALSWYFPFYSQKNQHIHQGLLLAALIVALGILVAHFGVQHHYFFLVIAAGLLILLSRVRAAAEWQAVVGDNVEGEGQLCKVRGRLFGERAYVRAFRELILLSRKNNSHRTQLQIQILKSKCNGFQAVNRGGAHKCTPQNVVEFQESIARFLQNLLRAAELAVSIFKFLQHREGRKQVLAKNIGKLMGYLAENKVILRRMLQLNEYSPQAKFLLIKTYREFYQDWPFLKEVDKWSEGIFVEKQIKEVLFSDKTTVIFINVLEQVGKIVRVSKNLPGVLGFLPSNLIGLSINQILPFSIKPHHDATLLSFIQGYTERDSYRSFDLQFYAYNSDFHLQEVRVRYSWVMTDFHTFHMAGVIQRIDSDTNVILTDHRGFLQGWTKKVGCEELNLDELSIAQRNNFNVLPLFPTMIKYIDSLGVSARTLFFKNQKARDPNLIVQASPDTPLPQLQAALLSTYRKMLKEEQFVGACFAEVQMTQLTFCGGRARMLRFVIKNLEQVQNFSQVAAMIETLAFIGVNHTDRSIAQPTNDLAEGSEKQELSIFSEDQRTQRRIDSNFTLYPQGPHIFPIEQLVFGQFSASRTSFELTNIYQNHIRKRNDREEKVAAIAPDSNFSPSLARFSSLAPYVLLVTVGCVVLVALSMAAVLGASSDMQSRCGGVIKRNVAAMIYLKSIFNPNATYVGKFVNGQLLQDQPYLSSQSVNYTSFLNDSITQNKYYFFNTQIPATLQRLLLNPKPPTVSTIPPVSATHYSEMQLNYQQVVSEFNKKFSDTQTVWADSIQSVRSGFFLRLGLLCVCCVLYACLLIVLQLRERTHKETLQAFFKFEKQELERKIASMGAMVRQLEAQVSEWHLLKEFTEAVKREQISNLQFGLVKNTYEVKIKFDYSPEEQGKLHKRKYYLAAAILILFLLLKLLFLTLHSTITLNALDYYQKTPADLDAAAKLILFPNYLIADLYLPLQSSIKTTYASAVTNALSFPVSSVPGLYELLSTAPCSNCTFMYPVLTTNYKSFYSTFEQRVAQMKSAGTPDPSTVTDLFYAADYVANQVLASLSTASYNYVDLSVVVFVLAVGMLCTALHWGSRSIRRETDTLELFLHFFSEEMITKNKHMNRLFSNPS